MTRRATRLAAAFLAIALAASACGNSTGATTTTAKSSTSDGSGGPKGGEATRNEKVALDGVPGVTDDAIRFAVVGTKTGNPLGICILDCYVAGVEAYFAFRNSEGGIYGRQLELADPVDDELSQNQQKSLDIASKGDTFGVFSATLLPSGWGDLDAAGIPTYTWGIHSADSANRPHNFPSTVVRCADCTRPNVPWVAKSVKAAKAASIGYGVSENSKVCTKSFGDSFTEFEDQTGVALAYTNDDLDYGLPNGIGPQVTAMKEAGVDFIATCIDLNGMKTLAAELHRQGMDDVVLYHPNSYDEAFIGESDGLFDGDVVSVQFRPIESDAGDSTLAEFKTWMGKQDSPLSELAMVGWINASLAFDGLLAAGPEFDRESVTAATNALEGWTATGLVSPIDWADAHTPYSAGDATQERECAAMVRVEKSAFVPFDDPTKPWQCWGDDPATEFEPTPTDFG